MLDVITDLLFGYADPSLISTRFQLLEKAFAASSSMMRSFTIDIF
jgi:hypothetical protein